VTHDDRLREVSSAHLSERLSFNVLCREPALEQQVVAYLEAVGFRRDPAAPIAVLVDASRGYALWQLESLNRTRSRVVVITSNPCAEYLLDLWELQPAVILANTCLETELANAVKRAGQGDRYRIPTQITTSLTYAERKALRQLACGLSVKQIALKLGKTQQSVKNTLKEVYRKLGLTGHPHKAPLYYWGLCHEIVYDQCAPAKEDCED
jgi:DNA-binding CsgD family transcriptional regulator